jgi:hypothetical protein
MATELLKSELKPKIDKLKIDLSSKIYEERLSKMEKEISELKQIVIFKVKGNYIG